MADIAKKAYDDAKKRLRKLEGVVYNTANQGYEIEPGSFVDATSYRQLIDGQKEIISNYESQKVRGEQQRIKAGEEIAAGGELTAEQKRIGKEYQTLSATANELTGKIKTYQDGIKAIQAWQAVKEFAQANPTAGFFLQTGKQGSGSRQVLVGSYQRLSDRIDNLDMALSNAQTLTDGAAQVGVTRTEVRIEGSGAAATRRYVQVVDDPTELDRRRKEIVQATGIQPPAQSREGEAQAQASVSGGAGASGRGRFGTAPIQSNVRREMPSEAQGGGTGTGGGGTTTQGGGGTTGAGTATRVTGNARNETAFLSQVNQQFGTSFKTVDEYLSSKGVKGMASKAARTKRWNEFVAQAAPVTGAEASAWLQAAKAEYGWVASLYETDDSVRQLLDTAVAQKYTGDRFLTEFYKTAWYANTDATTRNFYKLKNSDGYAEKLDNTKNNIRSYALGEGFNFNDDTLTVLAEGQLKYGWNEQATANAVGAEFVRQADTAEAQGRLLTGQTDIKTTGTFQELKRTAGQYLLKPTDAELEDYARGVITGTKTKETFARDMAARAKIRYGSLSEYIDQGYDLRSVTADYRQSAAELLETDENSIDFTDEKYANAFQYTDPTTNKSRQMNLQEWQRYIRSMPEWGNTENAKNTYRDVAFSIAQAFGQVQ